MLKRLKIVTLRKTVRALARCQRGVTAVEFAMVVPIFVMLVMGIIEMSMMMFTSAVMESATNQTARLGKTGYVAVGSTRSEQILANVRARTQGLLNPNSITISAKIYSAFEKIGDPEPCLQPATQPCAGTAGVNFVDINGNGTWDADMGTSGYGGAGDVVVYEVRYPWPVLTPVIRAVVGSTVPIASRTVVQNEPFNTGLTQ